MNWFYIGTLLDEYARTFESKINVSELQYCGEAILNRQAGDGKHHVVHAGEVHPADRLRQCLAEAVV